MKTTSEIAKLAILATVIVLLTVPTIAHSTSIPATPQQKTTLHPLYASLPSRVDTSPNASGGYNLYRVVSINFTAPSPTNATVFYSVGTFIQPSQCCPGDLVVFVSIDGGFVPRIDCGAATAQFTGVLSSLSCFGHLTFTAGPHNVALVVGNAGGYWTIELGSTTALLIEFG